MWRDVSRPKLLRPPVFFFGSTRRFAGLHFVISPKPGSDLKRSVGVSGRKFFRAITKPDRFFLLLSASRSLFPMPLASINRPAAPVPFARVITSGYIDNFLL